MDESNPSWRELISVHSISLTLFPHEDAGIYAVEKALKMIAA